MVKSILVYISIYQDTVPKKVPKNPIESDPPLPLATSEPE